MIGRSRRATDGFAVLSACLALGVGAWLVPASVHIVSWGNNGSVGRVALFAPAFYLRWTIGGALLGAVALWFLGRQDDEARRGRAVIAAPLSAVWAWGVPFLPWLPDRFPLLLMLAGPLRWLIAAAAAIAVLIRIASAREWRAPALPRIGRKTVFALSLTVYLCAGYRSLHLVGLGGDEPHYLVLTQSLLLDHDIQIENNHQRGDYRQYFGGVLRPDYLKRGVNGEIYSIHAPGLPAIVLPAFAAGGAWGAVALMCLFGALAAVAVFDLAGLVGGARAAWPTWASVCLTVPFIPHAWAIFPEMPGAAIVAWALLWAVRPGASSSSAWLWRGLCLAALPWLHTKFAVFLAVLALALALRARTKVAHVVSLAAPIAVSIGAWLAFFFIIYGTLDPQAPYGDYATQFVNFENVPRSIAGALFDQKFGLFVYAPIFITAIWGTLLLLRQKPWQLLAVVSVGLACVYTLSSARLYMWWGGSSAPARFLVPVAPLLAPALAAVFGRIRHGIIAAHVWAGLAISLLVSAISLVDLNPPLLFSNPHGVARLAEMFRGGSPLTAALPTFTEENWVAPLTRLGLWVFAACVAAAWAWFAGRRIREGRQTSVFWPLFAELVVFITAVAIGVGPYDAEARAETVRHGRFGLLAGFDPDGRRAFDYRQHAYTKMTEQQWLDVTSLTFRLDPSEPPDGQGRLTEGLTLPQGNYQVSVLFDDSVPRQGELLASLGGGNVLARAQAPLAGLTTMRLAMPILVPQVWVQMSDPPSAAAARRVDITPLSIVPRGRRFGGQVRRVESVAGRPDAYMAYVNDGAFPEGGVFWTRGRSEADLLVATGGASTLRLTVHAGPAGGAVRLHIDGRELEVALDPGETRVVPVPVPPDATVVSLAVQASGSFRPADVDRNSTDTRELGCQVRVEVGSGGD